MKSKYFFTLITVVIIAVLLFAACQGKSGGDDGNQSGGNTVEGNPSDGMPQTENAAEITVAVLLENAEYIKNCASWFENQTGIKVNIQKYGDESLAVGNDYRPMIDAYRERAITELMSRKGADIYDTYSLSYKYLGDRGLFCDIGALMEADVEFSSSDILMLENLMYSGEKGDMLYALPVGFDLNQLIAPDDSPLSRDINITWADFFDMLRQTESAGIPCDASDLYIFIYRFYSRADEFIDVKNRTHSLGSPAMVEFLEDCKSWSDEGLCMSIANYEADMAYLSTNAYSMRFVEIGNAAEFFCDLPEEYKKTANVFPFPVETENDSQLVSFSAGMYAINAASDNQRTAWEFLKFVLGEEQQKYFASAEPWNINFPINKNAFGATIERSMQNQIDLFSESDIAALKEVAIQNVNGNKPTFIYLEESLTFLVMDNAVDYFYGTITAEEAAKRMSDKATLLFKELS